MAFAPFHKVALIGIGLIGSSLSHVVRNRGLADVVVCASRSAQTRQTALDLGLVEAAYADPAEAVAGADLVVLCVPVGACGAVARAMAPALAPGAIITDVGSVKAAVIRDVAPALPDHVAFVPGHPIAGTEHSGPQAGFETLFDGRWCVLTPPAWSTDDVVSTPDAPAQNVDEATARVRAFWEACGSRVTLMSPAHHDLVLAVTSHLPHLIAYNIVGTAADLEEVTQSEVIEFSAGGFRDFTRLAASDPEMWRDIFLNNRTAVLETLGRFSEDLAALQRAIRWGKSEDLEAFFTRTRAIRRGIIEAQQDTDQADFGRRQVAGTSALQASENRGAERKGGRGGASEDAAGGS
ncbi:MAG: prephenate/arogenate dehydrogenase family protein [Pseudomonadota bacterium]